MFSSLIGATLLLSGVVSALPRPADSALGAEVGVSAVDGVVQTNSVELASQLSAESAAKTMGGDYSSSYDSSSYGDSSYDSSSYDMSNKGDSSYGSSGYDMGDSGYNADTSSVEAMATSSMMMEDTTSSMMMEDTTSSMMMEDTTSSMMMDMTTSTSAVEAYSTPSYGSGSDNWNSGYDDCVQQCLASYGGLGSATYAPTATSSGEYEGSSGSGATHTVIVAPSQGVLRYVPFALNASVGDTIMFMWGANNHTVTKSSALTPCNKTGDALFASGTHDAGFVFTQVVNTTDPTFFYCATPGHCAKGMFGIINPPNTLQGSTSVGAMMQSVSANNSDVQAYASYTSTQTAGTSAANWGTNMDIGSMPEWAHASVMENVLYTRNLLAANPDIMMDDGSIDLSAMASTPLMIPDDVSAALQNAAAVDSASGASGAASTADSASATASAAPETSSTASNTSNGVASVASSKMLVGVAALVATFFLL